MADAGGVVPAVERDTPGQRFRLDLAVGVGIVAFIVTVLLFSSTVLISLGADQHRPPPGADSLTWLRAHPEFYVEDPPGSGGFRPREVLPLTPIFTALLPLAGIIALLGSMAGLVVGLIALDRRWQRKAIVAVALNGLVVLTFVGNFALGIVSGNFGR